MNTSNFSANYTPPSHLILHCCYHKVGTVWFERVLRDIAQEFDWNFQSCKQRELLTSTHIFLQHHSVIKREWLKPYIGSHIIRDPRDIIISGYFYHLWCKEQWCTRRRISLFGKSYQQHLNSLSEDEGILFEIKYGVRNTIKQMRAWDYQDKNFIEVRYEDLFLEERKGFSEIFQFYGFNAQQITQALKIVERHSFKNSSIKREKHMRKGEPGDWKNYFKPIHIEAFKELYPDILEKLGYEREDDW